MEKGTTLTVKDEVRDPKDLISETEFSKSTKKIIIPDTMNKKEASGELMRQWNEEETVVNVDRSFPNWYWEDVLVAVKKATERHFGWIQGKTTESFFGTSRPTSIEVITNIVNGESKTETCFYGEFYISAWEMAVAKIGVSRSGQVSVSVTVKKRFENSVREYFGLIQTALNKESIYRSKAVVVKHHEHFGSKFDIIENKPSQKIVLNSDTQRIIDNFILNGLGESGKSIYLFTGNYGTGKTESAMRIGIEAVKREMSFFYCKNASGFKSLLEASVQYQPCLIFMEDVDEIAAGEERDTKINEILNTLDGVQTKGNDITVIFTTNHEKRINPALRRPGRIDMVVNFKNPDKEATAKIYEIYFKDLAGADKLNYKKLAKETPEVQGAVIAEIAKRAIKLANKGKGITDEYVLASIDSIQHQLELMAEPVESGTNKLEESLKVVGEHLFGNSED